MSAEQRQVPHLLFEIHSLERQLEITRGVVSRLCDELYQKENRLMPITDEQRRTAMVKANDHRTAKAQIRRALKSGDTTLVDLLENPPESLANVLLPEVLSWGPRFGSSSLTRVGRAALKAGVNLVQPFGRSGAHTRQWLIGYLGKEAE